MVGSLDPLCPTLLEVGPLLGVLVITKFLVGLHRHKDLIAMEPSLRGKSKDHRLRYPM